MARRSIRSRTRTTRSSPKLPSGKTEEVSFKERDRARSPWPAHQAGYLRRRRRNRSSFASMAAPMARTSIYRRGGTSSPPNGYAVLAVNYQRQLRPRGKFSRAIWSDWGHFESRTSLGRRSCGEDGCRGSRAALTWAAGATAASHRLPDRHRQSLQGSHGSRHPRSRWPLRDGSGTSSIYDYEGRPALESQAWETTRRSRIPSCTPTGSGTPTSSSAKDNACPCRDPTDVPGAAQPRRRHSAHHLSQRELRHRAAELCEGPLSAISRGTRST